MRAILPMLGLLAATPLPAELSPDNLIDNGDFEIGIEGWHFFVTHQTEGAAQAGTRKTPEALAWEQKDGAEKSKGCLKVTMPAAEKPALAPWNTGATCNNNIKTRSNSDPIRVSFHAKGSEGGETLFVGRTWGGFKQTVDLETTWKKYEMTFKSEWKDNTITFALTNRSGGGCEEGTFYLDNVEVIVGD